MALRKPTVTQNETATQAEEAMTTEGVEATTAVPEAEAAVAETQPAPEPQVEETQPATEQEVVQPESREVSAGVSQPPAKPTNAMANFSQEMAEEGLEGLDLTGMSFDRIKNHEGKFLLGEDEEELGTEFECVVHQSRNIYVVRQSDDNDAEMFYSYDPEGKTLTDGSSAQDKLDEWLDDGYGTDDAPLSIKPYLEVIAVLVNRDDEYDGHMVMLSIPPASTAKFAGLAAQAKIKYRRSIKDVVTRCQVGKKRGEGSKAYRPWVFKISGPYTGE